MFKNLNKPIIAVDDRSASEIMGLIWELEPGESELLENTFTDKDGNPIKLPLLPGSVEKRHYWIYGGFATGKTKNALNWLSKYNCFLYKYRSDVRHPDSNSRLIVIDGDELPYIQNLLESMCLGNWSFYTHSAPFFQVKDPIVICLGNQSLKHPGIIPYFNEIRVYRDYAQEYLYHT